MKKRFCPKCGSENITMPVLNPFASSIAINPGWICNKCGFRAPDFPNVRRKTKLKKAKK